MPCSSLASRLPGDRSVPSTCTSSCGPPIAPPNGPPIDPVAPACQSPRVAACVHAAPVDDRQPELPDRLGRCHVRQPAHVRSGAHARFVHGPDRMAVHVAGHLDIDVGRGRGGDGRTTGRRLVVPAGRPEARCGRGQVSERELIGLIAAPAKIEPLSAANPTPTITPTSRRRRRIDVWPRIARAMPRPANRLVATSAAIHGYAASIDGMSVCGPRPTSCPKIPPIDGTSRSAAPSPSHMIPANARGPRTAGGQMTAVRLMAIGVVAATPTSRSIGPPGRYPSNTSPAAIVHSPVSATARSRSSNSRTRIARQSTRRPGRFRSAGSEEPGSRANGRQGRRHKYRRSRDEWAIECPRAAVETCGIRDGHPEPTVSQPGDDIDNGDGQVVIHGRAGAQSAFSGRATLSGRIVLGASRGGPGARLWRTNAANRPASGGGDTVQSMLPTRATQRQLVLRGLTTREATNMTAWLCGIPVADQHWELREINRLLFVRELRRQGHFGARDGEPH